MPMTIAHTLPPPTEDQRSSPVNILFLTDAFLPHAGGARVYYYDVLQELLRLTNSRVTVLTSKVPGWREFDERVNSETFRLIRSGRPLQSWKYYEWPKIAGPLARVLPLLAREHFDLIHFGDLYPQGVLSLWLKKFFGIPYLAYCHGEEITQTDGRQYQPRVRNAIFREAEMVVAANEFARQNLIRIGITEERIQKITPGVDCVRFQPESPRSDLMQQFRLSGKLVLLTVARLVPRKGHKLVLEALRKLLPVFPNLSYLIVGTGPEQERLRRMVAEWHISHAVQFAGFVHDRDLAAYYNLADVYVMPNSEDKGDIEGFGMVFLEANACGKPVIGGLSGGAAEAVIDGETGFLVDPHDSEDLARAIRIFLENSEKAVQLGRQGLARARSEFSWTARARLLDQTNQRILANLQARRADAVC